MGRKAKVPLYKKVEAVEDYLNGRKSKSQILTMLQISKNAFEKWVFKYKSNGEESLITNNKNRCYTEEFKLKAIKDYLNGAGSLMQICCKYEISSHSLLQKWIKKYNGHEAFKSHNAQGDKIMIKGRKTTFEERIEIVAFCISNNYSYQMTVDKFQVSYQQVYSWVKKYEEHGSESLSDNRGKRKESEELSESEKLAARLKLLEAENNRLRMENDYLKKLEEIERRR
jgi:transposase-like protein